MESEFLELRLAEHAFFRETINEIKRKYRRLIFGGIAGALIVFVTWNLLPCSWLHLIRLCRMHC